jgi:hypothetical protein
MTTTPTFQNDLQALTRILKDLQGIIDRENKRPLFYEHLSFKCHDLICEFIAEIEADLDYDPTDDINSGEPPMTMQEMHSAAWQQHLEAHA